MKKRLAGLSMVLLMAGVLGCEADEIPSLALSPETPGSQPNFGGMPPYKESEPVELGVPAPWTPELIKAGMKKGRRWVLAERKIYWTGPEKTEITTRTVAEVTAVEDDHFVLARESFDENGTSLGRSEGLVIPYDKAISSYDSFPSTNTTIAEEQVSLGGRSWRARVYRNLSRVDSQEQILNIWASLEVPGLALKMEFKAPRRHETVELIEFQEGA